MAGSISKLTASWASITNENTLALANINFDFALVKVNAPKEYGELGALISQKRKLDAESGSLHWTARKLGALFEKVIPSTPALYKAYGKRVSEIAKEPEISPRQRSGIFASHIGADSASIWAAVTSGSGAIAVHLLACMLARMFSSPEAISIWVELVNKRKAQIQTSHDEAVYQHEHDNTLAAAMQEIPRADIGAWDNSARAWLQSGDQARIHQHKQLMLIVNNLSLPVSMEDDIFASVMDAWTSALKATDCLLRGMPQRVRTGSAILGISSWHLYPDLIVLGDNVVSVQQKDPLFENTAILTVGLQFRDESQQNISWSLPLSCFQYYGHPVRATRTVGQENTRISISQFENIILGCVLASWKDFGAKLEDGLLWFDKLEAIVSSLTQERNFENSQNKQYLLWFDYLCTAARRLSTTIASPSVECELAKQEVAFGRRRAAFIFKESLSPDIPLFGLSNITTFLRMMESDEVRVDFLRKIAPAYSMQNSGFIIRYRPSNLTTFSESGEQYEYATVEKILPMTSQKRQHNGRMKRPAAPNRRHFRWISISASELRRFLYCSCEDTKSSLHCQNRPARLSCFEEQAHKRSSSSAAGPRNSAHCNEIRHTPFWEQQTRLRALGECCIPVLDSYGADESTGLREGQLWFRDDNDDFEAVLRDFQSIYLPVKKAPLRSAKLKLALGDPNTAAIFSLDKDYQPSKSDNMMAPKLMMEVLEPGILDSGELFDYLYGKDLGFRIPGVKSLRGCAAMTKIYSHLPHATISTSIFLRPLAEASWLQACTPISGGPYSSPFRLTLPEVFSCIAMFDAGMSHIPPDNLLEVFAISTGNSIFVTSVLLEDPITQMDFSDVRRVIGNIGQPGISFLVAPPEPKTRPLSMDNWRQINHVAFTGSLENNLQQTSIHLSFTGYDLPLRAEVQHRHTIDRPARLVETLVSVHEKGDWIADLDLVGALDFENSRKGYHSEEESCDQFILTRLVCKSLSHGTTICHDSDFEIMVKRLVRCTNSDYWSSFTSIDNWDELLDCPQTAVPVVRTHKNWLARLAVAGVFWNMKDSGVILLPAQPCWTCCGDLLEEWYAENRGSRMALVL
ncbi:hypothetical protein BGZ60DRAFT_407344 [Tricladium varicosporioides]|nr:hypothetical protein BGZ60DRAFT_407344 [Hymenoscyphus varicosporioides]